MPVVRRSAPRVEMPKVRSVMAPLERADPFTYSSPQMWSHQEQAGIVRRQQADAEEGDGENETEESAGEDEASEGEAGETEASEEEGGEAEGTEESGDESSAEGEVSSDEGVGTSSEGSSDDEEPAVAPEQQKALAAASPPVNPSLPSVPNLGALPMPPMNTRRSMRLDKIKRKPKRLLIPRQAPPPPPPGISTPPPTPPPPVSPPPTGTDSEGTSDDDDGSSDDDSSDEEMPTAGLNGTPITPSPTIGGGTLRDATGTGDPESPTSSAFVVVVSPTANNAAASDSIPGLEPGPSGPPPETRAAIIAGTTVLGLALLAAGLFCLFRYCVPVRTWYTTRKRQHRDLKAERLGTSPQPWKWPLQFIFGSDRPAPPRRRFHNPQTSMADLDSNPTVSTILIADGFRPVTGDAGPYKPRSADGATAGWVANGFHNPFTRLSERLSGWPRRSGTAKWFFGGGSGNSGTPKDSSRWSDSEASEDGVAARTTYSETTFLKLYDNNPTPQGNPPSPSIFSEKDPVVEISHVELKPPLPSYQPSTTATTTTTTSTPLSLASLQTPTPWRARAETPRTSYASSLASPRTPKNYHNRVSTATTATNYTTAELGTAVAMPISSSSTSGSVVGLPPPPPPPKPNFGFDTSHFSASTMDPATPRTFVSEGFGGDDGTQRYGVPLPPIPKGLIRPSELGPGVGMDIRRRGSGLSVSSVGSGSSVGTRRSMRKSGVRSVGERI